MCNCKSYNNPTPDQTDEEVVLQVPEWNRQERRTVCVDACIAPIITALWGAQIWTLGCCCGHNGTAPRSVIVENKDRHKAEALIVAIGADLPVFAWELIGPCGAKMPPRPENTAPPPYSGPIQAAGKGKED